MRPVLESITGGTEDTYRVSTPFDLGLDGGAAIIRDIMHNIDGADIVVADLTNRNPNVFYELGITHALGKPCVAVLEEGQPIEFDVNAYRVYRVNLRTSDFDADERSYERARNLLSPALSAAHQATSDWKKLENPVIDYYHAPMTFISPAPALAETYFINFVQPVLTALTLRRGNRYFYDIGIAPIGPDIPDRMDEVVPLSPEDREDLDLHVVIPDRIDLAKHEYADRLRGKAHPAVVETSGRSKTLWAYRTSQGLHLIDIPTVMRGVESAVERRMRFPGVEHDSDEWRGVEVQEINRFLLVLETSIRNRLDNDHVRRRVRLTLSTQALNERGAEWLSSVFPQR